MDFVVVMGAPRVRSSSTGGGTARGGLDLRRADQHGFRFEAHVSSLGSSRHNSLSDEVVGSREEGWVNSPTTSEIDLGAGSRHEER
jgi:hypothetical protein